MLPFPLVVKRVTVHRTSNPTKSYRDTQDRTVDRDRTHPPHPHADVRDLARPRFIIKAEAQRRTSGTARYCYPFGVYPRPGGFDRGVRHSEMMNVAIRLWKKFRVKKDRRGRVRLDSLELRCAAFAVRVTSGLGRMRTRVLRKKISAHKSLRRKSFECLDERFVRNLPRPE